MGSEFADIPVRRSDLSTYARIRNAALEGFATRGVEATSVRDVAAAAGVSPGLVQHHFGTKDGLRAAVNEYVVSVAKDIFAELVSEASPQGWTAMGDIVTAWVRDNALGLRYLARALADGDEEAVGMLGVLLEIAQTRWLDPLEQAGTLRSGVDRHWAALHVFIFNLACVWFEPAISRTLPEPFFTAGQLKRWNAATTELYRQALTEPEPPRA